MAQNIASAAAPAAQTNSSPVERLQALKAMLDGGLITQGEYDRKKSEILAAL